MSGARAIRAADLASDQDGDATTLSLAESSAPRAPSVATPTLTPKRSSAAFILSASRSNPCEPIGTAVKADSATSPAGVGASCLPSTSAPDSPPPTALTVRIVLQRMGIVPTRAQQLVAAFDRYDTNAGEQSDGFAIWLRIYFNDALLRVDDLPPAEALSKLGFSSEAQEHLRLYIEDPPAEYLYLTLEQAVLFALTDALQKPIPEAAAAVVQSSHALQWSDAPRLPGLENVILPNDARWIASHAVHC
jgi:hypothetical protein